MPHYEDGQECKAGDIVVGKTYNTHGRTIVGTVLEVIPGSDSCNVRVAFAEVSRRPDEVVSGGSVAYRGSYAADHAIIKASYDYGETKAFKLLERA